MSIILRAARNLYYNMRQPLIYDYDNNRRFMHNLNNPVKSGHDTYLAREGLLFSTYLYDFYDLIFERSFTDNINIVAILMKKGFNPNPYYGRRATIALINKILKYVNEKYNKDEQDLHIHVSKKYNAKPDLKKRHYLVAKRLDDIRTAIDFNSSCTPYDVGNFVVSTKYYTVYYYEGISPYYDESYNIHMKYASFVFTDPKIFEDVQSYLTKYDRMKDTILSLIGIIGILIFTIYSLIKNKK